MAYCKYANYFVGEDREISGSSEADSHVVRGITSEGDRGLSIPEQVPDASGSDQSPNKSGTRKRHERSKPLGLIYFVATDDKKFIRIGYTDNMRRRIVAIQQSARKHFDRDVIVLGFFPGNTQTEAWIQVRFADDRYHGDWYQLSDEINAYIEAITLIPPDVPPSCSMRKAWFLAKKAKKI